MSEGHDEPAVVVVVESEGETGESEVVGEVQAVVEAEANEEVAEAAVQIAAINAERDIILAEIAAETTETLVEGQANQELEQCRMRIAQLEERNTDLQRELDLLTERLIPPPSSEAPPSPEAVDPQEPVEAGQRESQEVHSPAPEPERAKRKPHRWI